MRTSSYCLEGGCVAVILSPDRSEVLVFDTKTNRDPLRFSHDEWRAFLAGVRNGEFDLDVLAGEA